MGKLAHRNDFPGSLPNKLFEKVPTGQEKPKQAPMRPPWVVFPTPVSARPQYVQADGLHDGGEPHGFHAAHSKMFDTGSPIEFRHGRLDPGPIPIFFSEGRAVLLLSSTGQTDILVGVAVVAGLFPAGDGTLVKHGAGKAGSMGEGGTVA